MTELKPKELKMYMFVLDYNAKNDGKSPTLLELAKVGGYKSTSGTHTAMINIMKKGFVERYRKGWRALKEKGVFSKKEKTLESYQEIELSRGKVALVDSEDWEYLNKFNWHTSNSSSKHTPLTSWRAYRKINKRRVGMHNIIMNCPKGMLIDHINHDGLDNRKSNLRICTPAQNSINKRNSPLRNNNYKGVKWLEHQQRWCVRMGSTKSGTAKYVGTYDTEIEAAKAYNNAAIEMYGEFACLNPIPPNLAQAVLKSIKE